MHKTFGRKFINIRSTARNRRRSRRGSSPARRIRCGRARRTPRRPPRTNIFAPHGRLHYLCSDRQAPSHDGLRIRPEHEPRPSAPPAADAGRRTGDRHRQRFGLPRPPHQQAAALLLARTLGRGDDLRLVRRTAPAGRHDARRRVGRTQRLAHLRGELLRRNPPDRHHRPPRAVVREPP